MENKDHSSEWIRMSEKEWGQEEHKGVEGYKCKLLLLISDV